jgi:hypothetical protein
MTELPDAYSRVTNPERFRALILHALAVFDHLRVTYDVTERATFAPLPGLLTPFEHERPPITLVPVAPDAAPLGIAFTRFPGVIVQFGLWHTTPFPTCGCDACAENAGDEAARLDVLVRHIVAGEFTEQIQTPWLFGDARLSYRLGGSVDGNGLSARWTSIPRSVARSLRGGANRVTWWQPWPRRRGA